MNELTSAFIIDSFSHINKYALESWQKKKIFVMWEPAKTAWMTSFIVVPGVQCKSKPYFLDICISDADGDEDRYENFRKFK